MTQRDSADAEIAALLRRNPQLVVNDQTNRRGDLRPAPAELDAAMVIEAAYLRPNRTEEYAELCNTGSLGTEAAQTLEAMQPKSNLAARFEHLWAEWGGPELTREYKFSAARRWRLDYYIESGWSSVRIGIELEGGLYSGGRHSRAAGYLGDIEKYNAAAMAGIVVLRLGTGQVDAAHVAEIADYVRKQLREVKR